MIVTNCSIKGLKDAQWAEERQDRVPRSRAPRFSGVRSADPSSELGVWVTLLIMDVRLSRSVINYRPNSRCRPIVCVSAGNGEIS